VTSDKCQANKESSSSTDDKDGDALPGKNLVQELGDGAPGFKDGAEMVGSAGKVLVGEGDSAERSPAQDYLSILRPRATRNLELRASGERIHR
jgi:hypothetical protein